jgi:glycosyltransferase involved in cell wall biosynthesis
MKIRLIGQRNNTGIGIHYASFADELNRVHVIGELVEEIDFENNEQIIQAINTSQPDDINISFVAANIHEFFKGTIIQWIVFESTRIPEHILQVLHPADQVWVPSTWGKNVLLEHGIARDRIYVVPEGVDGKMFHNFGRKIWTDARPFRFLMIGKYEDRKSFDETLEAFAQTHGNRPDLELVIKSSYFTNQDQKLQQLRNKIDSLGLTNVQVLWGEMTKNQIADLYRSCDVFVFPSKGEGWGLPLIEAAASGMTIITTKYSGQTEFLENIPSSVLGVDYVLTDITCPEYQRYYPDSTNNWGQWARPDVFSIAACMQAACREYKKLYKNAQKNSGIIRNHHGWDMSVDQALAAMGSTAGF